MASTGSQTKAPTQTSYSDYFRKTLGLETSQEYKKRGIQNREIEDLKGKTLEQKGFELIIRPDGTDASGNIITHTSVTANYRPDYYGYSKLTDDLHPNRINNASKIKNIEKKKR